MKKMMSFALALVMVLAMSVTAFAESPYKDLNTAKKEETNVTAKYVAPTDNTPTVYYFTITWEADGANNLTYTGADVTYTWNTKTLKYESEINNTVGWSGTAKYKVEVENSSNAGIVATTTSTNSYNLSATIGDGEKASDTLKSAAENASLDGTTAGTATKLTVNYTFASNEQSTAITENKSSDAVNVGKITVTVSKPEASNP